MRLGGICWAAERWKIRLTVKFNLYKEAMTITRQQKITFPNSLQRMLEMLESFSPLLTNQSTLPPHVNSSLSEFEDFALLLSIKITSIRACVTADVSTDDLSKPCENNEKTWENSSLSLHTKSFVKLSPNAPHVLTLYPQHQNWCVIVFRVMSWRL